MEESKGPLMAFTSLAKPSLVSVAGKPAMILRPAMLSALEQSRMQQLPKRMFFVGPEGVGKSTALFYLAQACFEAGWIVATIPRAIKWSHETGDLEAIPDHGQFMQYMDAQDWLTTFIAGNRTQLANIPLRGDYKWGSKQVSLPADSSLLNVSHDLGRKLGQNLTAR